MATRRPAVIGGCLAALLVGWPVAVRAEREHFQIKLGATYEEGDFGASEKTRSLYAPVTLRYLGERFDFSVTGSFVHVDGPAGVTLVEGTPELAEETTGARETNSGLGDTILRFRYFLVDDRGPGSWVPSLAPFAKLKVPTADEDQDLGTGEFDGGIGLEWDKQFGRFFIFGDVGFTFMGDPPDTNFRDRVAASLGAGFEVTDAITVSALLDWRTALLSGNDDPLEVLGIVTMKLRPVLSLSPYVLVGLTDGSPDFGVGFELSYRFGRW